MDGKFDSLNTMLDFRGTQRRGFAKGLLLLFFSLKKHVSPGLLAWDATNRRGATIEAMSEPIGRATQLILHQDMLCCTPVGRERNAASRF